MLFNRFVLLGEDGTIRRFTFADAIGVAVARAILRIADDAVFGPLTDD